MSVPDFTGDVKRATRLVVRAQLPGTGEEVFLRANAFEARALQHEIDHCEGLLFIHRVAGAHANTARPPYLLGRRSRAPVSPLAGDERCAESRWGKEGGVL